jgi:hypothetical protein
VGGQEGQNNSLFASAPFQGSPERVLTELASRYYPFGRTIMVWECYANRTVRFAGVGRGTLIFYSIPLLGCI